MSLSAAQRVDIRRWMGYPTLVVDAAYADPVYVALYPQGAARAVYLTLSDKLDALSSEEESVLEDKFLAQLDVLEPAIPAAADNLDTLSAGPYTANPREILQRQALFDTWRRAMCDFLGFPPGPGLGAGPGGPLFFMRA